MNKDRLEEYRQIGQGIAYYREKRGISRQELAMRINVKEERLREIETFCPDINAPVKSPWKVKNMDLLFAIADSLKLEAISFFLPASEENFKKYRTDKKD